LIGDLLVDSTHKADSLSTQIRHVESCKSSTEAISSVQYAMSAAVFSNILPSTCTTEAAAATTAASACFLKAAAAYQMKSFAFVRPCPSAATTRLACPQTALVATSRTVSPLQERSTATTSGLYEHLHANVAFTCPNVKVIGHRGALYEHLENTRAGFLHCARNLNCHGVELDVFLIQGDPHDANNLIVFHGGGCDDARPGTLDEYCNVPNTNIVDLTADQLDQLVFNTNFDEFPCPTQEIVKARIPTLEQVLLDLKDYSHFNVKIELKGPDTVEPVLAVVERLGMAHQVQYSSFDHAKLAHLRRLRPDRDLYRTGALFDACPHDFLERALDCGATEVHLRYDTCTSERIASIHAANLASFAWFRGPAGMLHDTTFVFADVGNEDEACYQAVLDTGVQQICCNKPDVLMALLRKQEETTNSLEEQAECL
jgi:glycerophosphoryl diester phosphodiesterase